MPDDPRVQVTFTTGVEAPPRRPWMVCPVCYWKADTETSGNSWTENMDLFRDHYTGTHPELDFARAMIISTDAPAMYPLKTRCPLCGDWLELHGTVRFPSHYRHRFGWTTCCEGSGWTPEEVDQIVLERQEQARPGRYIRPHP